MQNPEVKGNIHLSLPFELIRCDLEPISTRVLNLVLESPGIQTPDSTLYSKLNEMHLTMNKEIRYLIRIQMLTGHAAMPPSNAATHVGSGAAFARFPHRIGGVAFHFLNSCRFCRRREICEIRLHIWNL